VQAYQTSQYVVLRGRIFLGKCRSTFAGSSDAKMNVQSACALNTQYNMWAYVQRKEAQKNNNLFAKTVILKWSLCATKCVQCTQFVWNVK
jgi:hypothetical protein